MTRAPELERPSLLQPPNLPSAIPAACARARARAAKLLRIKLYTQITSTPTLSHFAGAEREGGRPSQRRVLQPPTFPPAVRGLASFSLGGFKFSSRESGLISSDLAHGRVSPSLPSIREVIQSRRAALTLAGDR